MAYVSEHGQARVSNMLTVRYKVKRSKVQAGVGNIDEQQA